MKKLPLIAVLLMALVAKGDALDELMPRPREVIHGSSKAELKKLPGAYQIVIKNGKPVFKGFDKEGEHYARVTWWQLQRLSGGKKVPDAIINDWPEFKYRGVLLDCGRNYQSVESIRDLIDHIAKYKFNVFHWHIADDYGWRLESKKHPELQSPKAFGRQVGKFYTQKEFVETVRYAKKRGVTVVLELDMPGHTLAFRRATGFNSLATEEAKIVLGELIDEACSLLPKEDLPIIHLGTDEAREPGEKVPQSHLDYWAKKVTDNGRILMGWSPGLRLPGQTIKHLWRGAVDPRGDKCPYIDSQNLFYVNHVDCEAILSVAAYQKPCRWGAKEEQLGAFMCVWHDDNIADTEDVARMNFVYPAATMLSDSFWNGCKDEPDLYGRLPRPDDPRFARAQDIERRVLAQRDKVLKNLNHPFPYVAQTWMRWKMTDAEIGKVIATDIPQATVYPNHFWYPQGGYVKATNGTVILETWIESEREVDCGAWIGMTGFSRSDGRSRDAPTPKLGEWNKHGAYVELNGKRIDPPKWTHPGVGGNPKEMPLVDEDYWYREPTKIHLKKGVNHVKMVLPKRGGWKWIGTFLPMEGDSDHPKEVKGLLTSRGEK